MDNRNIVITGLGLVTALGKNVVCNWRNLELKNSGIGCYPRENQPEPFNYIGKVHEFRIPKGMPRKIGNQMKFLNRGSLLGFIAAHEAVTSSGMEISQITPDRRALCIGSGDHTKTGYDFLFPAVKKGTDGKFRHVNSKQLNETCLHEVNPFYLLESLHNNLFSFLSAFFDLKGPNATLASLSPCGLHALEAASRMIRQDQADMALVVGCGNWITEIPLYELQGLGLFSHCREGAQSFKPLDKRRNGFIPGEGGAAVLLEAEGTARKRGAFMHGRIRGTGNCIEFDSAHGLGVSTKVSLRCMAMALKDAGVDAADLGVISPHGNATRMGDRSELESIQTLLGNHSSQIPIVAMKPFTGHMGAASDIAEMILGLKGLQKGMAPATLNFKASEERFSHLNISNAHLSCAGNRFLSVSCGMGGQVASVLVEG